MPKKSFRVESSSISIVIQCLTYEKDEVTLFGVLYISGVTTTVKPNLIKENIWYTQGRGLSDV